MQRVLVCRFLCNKFGVSIFTNMFWGICVRSARLYETHLYISNEYLAKSHPVLMCECYRNVA